MRISRALVAGAVAVGVTVTTAGAASADAGFRAPEIAWANANVVAKNGGEQAEVLVKYRCWGVPVHLWASVKQGPELDPSVPGGTFSSKAVSWREAPEGPLPTCDGTWQVERVTVESTPDTAGWEALSRGAGWLQFVIFAADPAVEGPESVARAAVGDPAAGGKWVRVVGNA